MSLVALEPQGLGQTHAVDLGVLYQESVFREFPDEVAVGIQRLFLPALEIAQRLGPVIHGPGRIVAAGVLGDELIAPGQHLHPALLEDVGLELPEENLLGFRGSDRRIGDHHRQERQAAGQRDEGLRHR